MKMVRPQTIDSSKLISSNISITQEESEYNSGTTYAAGDLVQVTSAFKIYESQVGSNTGNNPVTDTGTNWVQINTVNRYRMFSDILQEQTVAAGINQSILVEIQGVDITNTIAFANLDATDIDITCKLADNTVVYQQNHVLDVVGGVGDFYEWFFEQTDFENEFAITDLPTFPDMKITVSINKTDGIPKCGACVIGQYIYLGDAQWEAAFGIADYSQKQVDAYGRITVENGRYAETAAIDLEMPRGAFNTIYRAFQNVLNTPIIWVVDERNDFTVLFGYYREFALLIESYDKDICQLELEGLT